MRALERPSGAKARRSWQWQTALAFLSLAVHAASASPHEVSLVEQTLEARFVEDKPKRLIGDKAYDSDGLNEDLKVQGIELIAPHRQNRKKPTTQDGRASSQTLQAAVEGGKALQLAAELQTLGGSVRTSR